MYVSVDMNPNKSAISWESSKTNALRSGQGVLSAETGAVGGGVGVGGDGRGGGREGLEINCLSLIVFCSGKHISIIIIIQKICLNFFFFVGFLGIFFLKLVWYVWPVLTKRVLSRFYQRYWYDKKSTRHAVEFDPGIKPCTLSLQDRQVTVSCSIRKSKWWTSLVTVLHFFAFF